MQEVRVDHRREQVVGRADRVDVAGEVEVHVLHGHDLRVAGAGRAALDPEHRPERRLAQAEHGPLAELAEALGERHRRRRLALARRASGVIAVTLISLPSGRSASRSSTDRLTLAL